MDIVTVEQVLQGNDCIRLARRGYAAEMLRVIRLAPKPDISPHNRGITGYGRIDLIYQIILV
jgi:hypothetical protein